MADALTLAVEATQRLRASAGFRALPASERLALESDLGRVTRALTRDPFAVALDEELPIPAGLLPPTSAPAPAEPRSSPPPPPPTNAGPVSHIGRTMAEGVAAVDFPGFVAGLVQGVFQAIVDATAQQVREYAALVANLSRSLEDFTEDNVTPNQARDRLVAQHPQDLQLALPAPGRGDAPRVVVRPGRAGTRPAWLAGYDLGDSELTDELVEGQLVPKSRMKAGEERLQTLATLVLMGINRIVVNDGAIKARLNFHATAREQTSAEMAQGGGQTGGLASRANPFQGGGTTMMVSTASANAQAESGVRADLLGEVRVSFRTETFNLNNFANTQAIQLINRHARWQGEAPVPPARPPTSETT